VLTVLNHPEGTTFSSRERRHLAEAEQSSSISVNHGSNEETTSGAGAAALAHSDPALQAVGTTGLKEGSGLLFKLPPLTAIAGVLIRDWAEGRVGEVAHKQMKL
jgi:NAD+ diphosphatase